MWYLEDGETPTRLQLGDKIGITVDPISETVAGIEICRDGLWLKTGKQGDTICGQGIRDDTLASRRRLASFFASAAGFAVKDDLPVSEKTMFLVVEP